MTEIEYTNKIRALNWDELKDLWQEIIDNDTPEWESGKAFEYLVIRMFELDGLEVKYPFSVSLPYNLKTMEQLDGVIYLDNLAILVESKDYSNNDKKANINIEPIAKIRNQLNRRPYISIGCVFSAGGFTEPVASLIDYLGNETILLWQGEEIEKCLTEKKIKDFFKIKFQNRIEHGIHDFNITTIGI
ncbi:restriction endonuclease [Chryseobacterium sp. MEBOG07]|uniref:restriction endonuclease n=1 Tax=Chryseobacterium sp. MEBOG07 TaxID=2879939 RepID=UPI001EFFE21D|nr:restriction endonuclease [Chryseobacterium sp. MEBOG07]UKB80336.1 restriction endonuclease [Chryseobacterium sp. MEBOG07]